ncbi:hypothetical protein GCM10022222_64480 [Amycolatopsis ultiminotia]|uniref:WXG100 family type VII secretion target n=1 Tax=Amycolatopsis ultiminotia TaxID=543629 RepID=A0ABP6XSD5_9PSEU
MDSVPPQAVPSEMRTAEGRFAHAIDSANACLRPVNFDLADLQASWRGDASVRLGQAINDWERQFEVILARLGALRDLAAASPRRSDEQSTRSGRR